MRACFPFLLIVLFLFLCVSCRNGRARNEEEASALYRDYRVWGDESSGEVTVRLQYRIGNAEGPAIRLAPPTQARFDGLLLQPDSSRMNGMFYELNELASEFAGNHQIIFTSPDGINDTTNFRFPVFSLATAIPDSVSRGELLLSLDGLDTIDRVHVLLTDTAFYSRGIDRVDSIRNGVVTITNEDWRALKNGPVHLELYREEERRAKSGPHRGRLVLSYGLRREFSLRD